MIVKYYDNGVWGYIDNVRQAASKDIDCDELINRYDAMPVPIEGDAASYMNGERLPEDIVLSNKVFSMATIDTKDIFEDSRYGNCHQQNLIDGKKAMKQYSASFVLLYLNDHKEYDTLALVTNQECFLMNDKGQTIERLV
jgi:hypothetical protein